MDFEQFTRQLQLWTNQIPLIILGSGASVPFGLPSMWKLGEYIKENVILTDPLDIIQFEEFKTHFDRNGNLESTLLSLQLRDTVLKQIVIRTWEMVNKIDLDIYSQLSSEFDFPLRKLISHLLNTAGRKLSIVTTNYDRLAEYASSLSKAIICTGYSQNYFGHFSPYIHTNNLTSIVGYSGQVNIWKVHGSLDWFTIREQESIQMPLLHALPIDSKPMIVTPGLSKYLETHNEPYRTIFTQADAAIETANSYICIGYGFNDIHVQPKLITQIKTNKPIVVLSKEITDNTKSAIIESKGARYILMEEASGGRDTKIYSSTYGEHTIENQSYWQLEEFNKLIM